MNDAQLMEAAFLAERELIDISEVHSERRVVFDLIIEYRDKFLSTDSVFSEGSLLIFAYACDIGIDRILNGGKSRLYEIIYSHYESTYNISNYLMEEIKMVRPDTEFDMTQHV